MEKVELKEVRVDQYGYLKVEVGSETIPHDMYSEYNVYLRFNFLIFPPEQSLNDLSYSLPSLKWSPSHSYFYYHLFRHSQNPLLLK